MLGPHLLPEGLGAEEERMGFGTVPTAVQAVPLLLVHSFPLHTQEAPGGLRTPVARSGLRGGPMREAADLTRGHLVAGSRSRVPGRSPEEALSEWWLRKDESTS